MALGFAMCATLAVAQTTHLKAQDVKKNIKISNADVQRSVDYKASIFSKDAGHDTITTITFSSNSDAVTGSLGATDRIQDTLVGASAHGLTGSANLWRRYASTTAFTTNVATYTPGLAGSEENWMVEDIATAMADSNTGTPDDGFVVISLNEQNEPGAPMNAWVQLPTVQNTDLNNTQTIEVALTQDYIKYYDRCFIDYKYNGNWYTREINLPGIDCDVNTAGMYRIRYAMPMPLAEVANIELRLRAFANPAARRVSAYGYYWAVDNVAIIRNTNEHVWSVSDRSATYFDGFYGMIPQGMEIPVSFGINVNNISSGNITNARATVYTSEGDPADFEATIPGDTKTIPAGNVMTDYPIYINERGMVDETIGVDEKYYQNVAGYEGGSDVYFTEGVPTGFQGRSLPTDHNGENLFTVTMSADNGLQHATDTMAYTVTGNIPADAETHRVAGYRWGRDNGIITSHTTPFRYAFSRDGLVSESDEANSHTAAGYTVYVRFVTPSVIPETNGEPWVFRGLELVHSTRGVDLRNNKPVGAQLTPVVCYEYGEAGEDAGLGWRGIDAGALPYTVDANDFDMDDTIGYRLPGSTYKSINIKFPEQVAMEPNTAYLFGYRLENDAQFALASQYLRYRDPADPRYLKALSTTADAHFYGTHRMIPANVLDIYVQDPMAGRAISSWNIDYFPVVRPIVGPAEQVVYKYGTLNCTNTSADHQSSSFIYAPDSIGCGEEFSVPEGGSREMYVLPATDNSFIDSIKVNGVKLEEGDAFGQMEAHEYNVVDGEGDDEVIRLYRSYYSFSLIETGAQDYNLEVFTSWKALGIDPVAPEVGLALAPNPATSTVKLNISGVTGMVNCNIIDMSGRVVYNANINAEGSHIINVNNMPAGAYFVRVTNDTFSKIEKLIIK